MFFIPDEFVRGTVREVAGNLPATTTGAAVIQSTVRVENDAALVRSSAMNVTEIAFESGFEDVFHFSRVFKERFNVPPVSYRQSGSGRGLK